MNGSMAVGRRSKEVMVCRGVVVAMAVGRWPLAEGSDDGWLVSVAGHFPWPVTYLRRLNRTNEKISDTKKSLVSFPWNIKMPVN